MNPEMKKGLAILLVFAMLFSIMPVSAFAEETSIISNGITWSYNEDTNTLTISGNGTINSWPEELENKKEVVTRIIISEGVTTIGHSAFSNCSSLTTVTIPGSVTAIGNSAFANCSSLTTVTYLGISEPSFGSRAFSGTYITVYVPVGYESDNFCGFDVEVESHIHVPADAVREKEVAATCYAEGSYDEVVYCSVKECGEKLSSTPKTIDKVAHTAADAVRENIVEATCKDAGSYDEVVYCSVEDCKAEISRVTKTIDKLTTHTYGNDRICDICGYTKPSSGGGFSGSYNYPVKADNVDGADVTLSDSYANAGETVTITVKPEAGKKVDEVIVTDASGKVIAVTEIDDNQYTFTMPAGKVNIKVTTEAADYDLRIVMQINNKNIVANNRTITNDVAPVIVGDRTLVPVRMVTELLGGSAHWDNDSRTVTLKIDGKVLSMTIGKEIPGFGTSAVIMNSRTYVPIRYVAEMLGAEVTWIAATQQIVIEK